MGAKNMDDIAELFKTLRFRKQIVGGVSEIDVWKKLNKIQEEYRSAYEIQQERYEARLQERDEEIASLREQISKGTAHE
ncbi:hypothetical protein B5E84_12905 [Lachnoclostridium sp. An14]|uniref:hypothetical protein n=1 Tax=Lachnoclostridium sp. An14 TaxID=1965562 RepID=UPI000B39D0E7|nr:hypothetical protein [Lachnoclostridium sp. An14]OUQ16074.1 hypothetical protein B5E84_12905 [Lachnoclostridium sp. An14]